MATESFQVLQTFGYQPGRGIYKLLLQTKNGKRYLVWYFNQIEVNAGEEVLISIDYYNNWKQINNPRNGKQADIAEVNTVS